MKEIVADRTATSSTWQNSNGTLTVRQYMAPHYYKSTAGAWQPVDPVLTATSGKPGWWHGAAGSLPTSFGPAGATGGAEQVSITGTQVGFAPLRVADPSLTPTVVGATATYPDLWPDTSVTDQVTASQVKENIELASAAAPSSFSFRLTGATAHSNAAGGLDVIAGGHQVGTIPPLSVTMRLPQQVQPGVPASTGEDVTTASGARLTVSGDVVTVSVSVSKSWLAGLPASAFPVVIDPAFTGFQSPSAYVSVGSGATSHTVMQVGRDSQGFVWRTAVYVPAPTPPSQITESSDHQPWVLADAGFNTYCPPHDTQTVPSIECVGLENVSLYGLVQAAPPSYPRFGDISPQDGFLLWASPPGQLVGEVSSDTSRGGETALLSYMHQQPSGWWFGITGNETGGNNLVEFDPGNTYVSYVYVQQPDPTYITAPSGVIATPTPTLTAAAVTDTTNTPTYDFQISTSANGTGTIVDSGWLDNQTSWTVPPGSLQDGTTYYATVRVAVTEQSDTTCPCYVPPAAPVQSTSFTLKERLGGGGPSPTDTVGAPPQEANTPSQGVPSPGAATASETVNMLTGNLSVAVSTPGMQALDGSAGVTLTYNSMSSSLNTGTGYGLTGQYYADDGTHTFDSPLLGQRTDPGINQSWGFSPPVGGLKQGQPFIVRWTGVLSLPAGTWELGGLTPGGMRVYLNGSATPSYDDWSSSVGIVAPSYGTTTINGGAQYQLEVDSWNYNQAGTVQLWARNTATPQPTDYIVPVSWLTPVATGVPPGWNLLANPAAVQWTHAEDRGGQVMLTGAAGDTVIFTKRSDGTYYSPPGDTDLLSVDGTGHLQLATSDGHLYAFNADGTLAAMTTTADDLHPTDLQYTYAGAPPLLTSITDPVSGRSVTLAYGGNSTCPTVGQAPSGMLCEISYWDGTTATFGYNSSGQLTSVTSPGGQTSSFGYDGYNRLADIRDGLATDYLASGGQAGTAVDCGPFLAGLAVPPVDTQICYDGAGRVASVTQPAPRPRMPRPGRTYTYASGYSDVVIDGFTPASGYAERTYYDAQGRVSKQTDSGGRTTTTMWANAVTTSSTCGACGVDEPYITVDPAGEQTSTVYDTDGNATDVYGPAPVACFTANWPVGITPVAPIQGYLPVANPQGTTSCGVAVAHTHNGYDEGITGLAETFWSNGQFAGAAVQHGTGDGGPQPDSFCAVGTLCAQWAEGSPPVGSDSSGHWSLRLTGTISAPVTGGYGLWVIASQPTTVTIDGYRRIDDTPAGDPNFVPGQDNRAGPEDEDDAIVLATGVHQIELDFQGSASQANDFKLSYEAWAPYGILSLPAQAIPNSKLDPDYHLKTSTTDPDGKTTTTSYSNATIGPEYGLPTATTVGAGTSDALTTTTTYETPGPSSYLRKTANNLPAGNTTTYAYYTGVGGPVAAACGVSASTPQGGQLEQQTDPSPGGSGQARVRQFIYDAVGHQLGVRIGTPVDIAAAPWQCITYDSRGRLAQQTFPAANGSPARTVTYSYSVGGNPLVSSVSDPSGTITSTADLLGRVISYTDVWGQTTTTDYNQAGLVTDTSGPGGSFQLGYDGNAQPTTTTVNGTLLATASYDTAGRMNHVTYPNNTETTIGYDSYGRQKSLAHIGFGDGGQTIADAVTRSLAGRESTETTSQPDGSAATASYCYDPTGRLTGVAGPGGCSGTVTGSYSYAPNPAADQCPTYGGNPGQGANTNRTSVTTPSGTTDYCYNTADQLVASITGGTPDTSYAYNERGDQTSDNGTTYTWDSADRAATATTGTTTTASTYDPVDRLIQSASSLGSTVRYAYAGYSDSPAAVLSTSNNILQQLVALPGGVTVTLQPSGNTWAYANLQGDTTVTANDTGTLTSGPVTYDPWGNLNPGQTAPGNTVGRNTLGAYAASGKLTNTATGTVLLGARTFNPAEARFLSVDPVSGGCANQYTYAFGDPLNHPDLSGRNACVDFYESYSDFNWWEGAILAALLVPGPGWGDAVGGAVELFLGEEAVGVSDVIGDAFDIGQEMVSSAPSPSTVVAITKGSPLAAPKVDKAELLAEEFAQGDLTPSHDPHSNYMVGWTRFYNDCKAAGLRAGPSPS